MHLRNRSRRAEESLLGSVFLVVPKPFIWEVPSPHALKSPPLTAEQLLQVKKKKKVKEIQSFVGQL